MQCIYEYIKSLISQIAGVEAVIERPKNREFGHFATPVAFTLAKSRKLPPQTLAKELCEQLRAHSDYTKTFSDISEMKGYINCTLAPALLERFANAALEQTNIGGGVGVNIGGNAESSNPHSAESSTAKESILLEYVSANPTGPLHIGHARGAVLGDSLQRLGRYLGYAITSEYYVNDAGAQIYKLGKSIYLAGREILGEQVVYDDDCYKGEYIIEIAQLALEKFGREIFTTQEPESKASDTNITRLGDFGKELMLEEIKSNLSECGIHFDTYVSEKSLFSRWDSTLSRLKAHGGVYESQGKLWLASSSKGDEKDRCIVREDGEPTYLAGDIIYHGDKFSRDFSRYINIWGADHHGYIPRVRAAISYLGFDESRLEVLLAQMVSLLKDGKPYKMSKRAGNFILMRDVVADIGADALRFVFLSKKPDTHLEFDVADLRAQDSSNPIFYINYANARIHTLLQKSTLDSSTIARASLQDMAKDMPSESGAAVLGLVFDSLLLPRVAQMAWEERSLQKVCEYAKNLAASLHGFYNAHKILDSQHEASILRALELVSLALTQSLALLGIEARTRM